MKASAAQRADLLAAAGRSVREARALSASGYGTRTRKFQPREAPDAQHLVAVEVVRAPVQQPVSVLAYADLTPAERREFDLLYSVHDPDDHAIDLVEHLLRVVRRAGR